MSQEKYYRVNQAAGRTGILAPTWRHWISEGKISVVRVGRCVLIPESELERMLTEGFQPRIEANRK